MSKWLLVLLALTPSAALAQQTSPPPRLTLYKTVSSAACTGDTTVWLDPAERVYYVKGDKLYGKTGRGGYNCRKQADAAGYRPHSAR